MLADDGWAEFQRPPDQTADRQPDQQPGLDPDDACTVSVSSSSCNSVVHVTGDLDLAARELVYRACLSTGNGAVEVDLAQVRFIDCAGYGGLVAAGVDLRAHGGSLIVRHRSGQPEHLRAALIRIDPLTTIVWPDVLAPDVLPI